MKTKLLVCMLLLIAVAGTAQTNRRDKTRTSDGKETEAKVSEEKREVKAAQLPQGSTESRKPTDVSSGENRRSSSVQSESRNKHTERSEGTRKTEATHAREREKTASPSVNQPVRNENAPQNVTRGREASSDVENRRSSEGSRNSYSNTQRSSQGNSSGNEPQKRRTYSDGTNTFSGNAGNTPNERRTGQDNIRTNDSRRAQPAGNNHPHQGPVIVNGTRTVVYNGETRVINVNERINDRRYYSNHNHYRHPVKVYVAPPVSVEVRRVKYPYRPPVYIDIFWTTNMYREYRTWYPEYCCWDYPIGYRIETVSAYDAIYYVGDIARVYGKVHEVYYAYENDEYYLYFGAPYPYQDFSVIIPGWVAREFSRRPIRWFQNRHVAVTGLITVYEGKPEILVKRPSQIERYY